MRWGEERREGGVRAATTSGNPATGVEVRDREHRREAPWRVGRLDLDGKPLGLRAAAGGGGGRAREGVAARR
jgi:hypothetical protein